MSQKNKMQIDQKSAIIIRLSFRSGESQTHVKTVTHLWGSYWWGVGNWGVQFQAVWRLTPLNSCVSKLWQEEPFSSCVDCTCISACHLQRNAPYLFLVLNVAMNVLDTCVVVFLRCFFQTRKEWRNFCFPLFVLFQAKLEYFLANCCKLLIVSCISKGV